MTLGKALRPLPPTIRRQARIAYSYAVRGRKFNPVTLENILFGIQDGLESSSGYQHGSERLRGVVGAITAVRGVLADDSGQNDPVPGLRWPAVDAARATMNEKRRKGNPLAFTGIGRFSRCQGCDDPQCATCGRYVR